MERFTVTHHHVPIGTVDLPTDRDRAGGDLDPLPAVSAVAPVLAAVAGGMAALALLDLARGAAPPPDAIHPLMHEPFLRAAALEFELYDVAGHLVAAELVRVADLGRGRLHVRAHFRHQPVGVPATLRDLPIESGSRQPAA